MFARLSSSFRVTQDVCRTRRVSPLGQTAVRCYASYTYKDKRPRLQGTVIAEEGEGADKWVTIEEDVTKDYYSWVIWPFPFYGIHGHPLKVGDRLSFIDSGKAFRATALLLEETGEPPGVGDQQLTH